MASRRWYSWPTAVSYLLPPFRRRPMVMPLAQQEANRRASAGVPIRKPVRPESTLSWSTWVLSTPIPTTVRFACRLRAAAPRADHRDPERRPHVQVEHGGGVGRGHHLVGPPRVGRRPAVIMTRSWAENRPPVAGAISWTCASSTVPRFPPGVMVAAVRGTATATPRTCGSRASWRANPGCVRRLRERLHDQIRRIGAGQELRVGRVGAAGRAHRCHGHAARQADQHGQGQVADQPAPERDPEPVPRHPARRAPRPGQVRPLRTGITRPSAAGRPGCAPPARPGTAATRLASEQRGQQRPG